MNNRPRLDCIERSTAEHPTHSVIWLHGLGADGHDFFPIVPELKLATDLAVRFIFPHAPFMPVTLNDGMEMRAWYDILSLDNLQRAIDLPSIQRTLADIRRLIADEIERGIPASNIVLAGFSQGGAVAYLAGTSYPETLAGIMALSTYLPSVEFYQMHRHKANHHTPIFAAHGLVDPVVDYSLGETAAKQLHEDGYPVTWHNYNMPHSVSINEIAHMSAWLSPILRA